MVWCGGIANALLSALLSPGCALCGRLLDRPLDGAVCMTCWRAVLPQPSALRLASGLPGETVGAYEGVLRDLIHALKYEGRRSIAPRLALLMRQHGQTTLAGADLVIPVPLHWRRLHHRGFNQADELARGLGVPVLRGLRRVRATRSQTELPAEARRGNVRRAFALRGGWASRAIRGKVCVVIDDVATTGATLEACASVLRAAGARQVRALTAARVVSAPR
jgi:ComF family protein